MGIRANLKTLPARFRLAARILARRSHVPWGMDPWLDVRAHLVRSGLPLDRRTVVFDVGANVGQTARAIRRWLPRVDLHCYEPIPATFAMLQRNVSDAVLEQSGLGAVAGSARMDLAHNERASRMIKDAEDVEVVGDVARIEVRTVDEELDRLKLDRLSVLKLDVEGHELEVLEGAADALRGERIDLVLAEARFGATGAPWHTPIEDLEARLEPFDFRAVGLYVGFIEGDRGINDADVLFMRTTNASPGWLSGPFGEAHA